MHKNQSASQSSRFTMEVIGVENIQNVRNILCPDSFPYRWVSWIQRISTSIINLLLFLKGRTLQHLTAVFRLHVLSAVMRGIMGRLGETLLHTAGHPTSPASVLLLTLRLIICIRIISPLLFNWVFKSHTVMLSFFYLNVFCSYFPPKASVLKRSDTTSPCHTVVGVCHKSTETTGF